MTLRGDDCRKKLYITKNTYTYVFDIRIPKLKPTVCGLISIFRPLKTPVKNIQFNERESFDHWMSGTESMSALRK